MPKTSKFPNAVALGNSEVFDTIEAHEGPLIQLRTLVIARERRWHAMNCSAACVNSSPEEKFHMQVIYPPFRARSNAVDAC